MSDELRRRFLDKIHHRPVASMRHGGISPQASSDPDSNSPVRILGVEHGTFPSASALNERFVDGRMRVRLTLDLGNDLRQLTRPLDAHEREGLLTLCPGLPGHACGVDGGILDLLSPERGSGQQDGMTTAHLIEHVAIDLEAASGGSASGHGAIGAHRDRPGRFDVFLECDDPVLGRAAAVLAAAAVRDLRAGADRTRIHRHCRDLLTYLASSEIQSAVPEDIARLFDWTAAQALEALEAVVRLGFLEAVRAPFTFSSPSGLLFRRAKLT